MENSTIRAMRWWKSLQYLERARIVADKPQTPKSIERYYRSHLTTLMNRDAVSAIFHAGCLNYLQTRYYAKRAAHYAHKLGIGV